MAEQELRAALGAATARIATLEESLATLHRDLQQLHANHDGYVMQTTQLIAEMSRRPEGSSGKVLNHTAAKSIDVTSWSGNDDKAQSWK